MFFSKLRKKSNITSEAGKAELLESDLDKTVCLDSDESIPAATDECAKFTIKLTELTAKGKSWTLPVVNEVLIGRAAHCILRFSDKSISREQCKIVVKADQLIVVQIGTTNSTRINDAVVQDSAPLHTGDVLKFGRGALRVDFIQAADDVNQKLDELLASPGFDEDKTLSFF